MTPAEKSLASPVVVSIVNWNRWQDTVECLKSLLALDYAGPVHIIVCDNASSDRSVESICEWLRERGPEQSGISRDGALEFAVTDSRTVAIIAHSENAGYAGGNNVALQYALRNYTFAYAWILNNDTVVEEHALTESVARMEESPEIGICGAKLLYYTDPQRVQAYAGVAYSVCTGRGKALGEGDKVSTPISREWVEQNLSYVSGACMLVSKRFLDAVGLMSERYFMYFEELDWVTRSRGLFKLGFAPKAIVYHKEGATIGTVTRGRKASLTSEFYQARNKLVFTKTFYPLCLVTVWCVMFIHALKRFVFGQTANGRVLVEVLFGRQTPRSDWMGASD